MLSERNKTKIKVTLDTNILISGSFWKGDSYKILLLIETQQIICILSPNIIEEYKEVMESEEITEKIFNKNLAINKIINYIILTATIISPTSKLKVVKKDPDDNKIIECAVEGKSDFIITNDKHLLNLKKYKKIKIITPEEFLRKLEK
jgi:putative PIN family toxin of toxin-antitoxin system